MKTKKIFIHTLISFLILLMVTATFVFAQDQPTARRFGQEELDQMLAPIALYPDSLLAQILMAATYPLEVVQADRWTKANRNLSSDQLNDALDQRDWDPSIKALVPFPQVLSMMSERLEWTQKLGDAFLDQQDEVMDTVQRLRARAQAAGNLRDTEQQRVIVQERIIEIEPVQPEVVYVPVYDPTVIYGPWWYPAFPPFFFPPPPGVILVRGFGFWRGATVGRAWGHAWGNWDWHHHYVNVNINRHININRNINITRTNIQTTRWQHDVSHRKGVTYRNEATRERYGQSVKGAETRRDFRGFGQETRYQQGPVATRQSPAAAQGLKASGVTPKGPAETKGQQASVATRQSPAGTQGLKASGVTPKGPAETKGQQASVPTRQSLDLSKNKSAFAAVERGNDVRMQSNRGLQSRQSMSSKGTGSVGQGNVGRGGGSGGVSKDNVGRPR
jgi:hypothetical protein